jgi:phosphoribosylformylglycinamidine synthase subunit PurQ / glutaminase
MKFGVVVFPGSNCDDDAFHAVGAILGESVEFIWHRSQEISGFDAILLPGGFAFGDYLRTGAIARFSPVMTALEKFARSGGLVLGICNGFQVLLEAGLLPGAMLRNRDLRFLCRDVHVRVDATDTPFTCAARHGQVLKIPIAHMEGNYFVDDKTLAVLERNNQVVLRYTTPQGELGDSANPNGSLAAIAGICNRERNIMGMMPHPERAVEAPLGSSDGLVIFRSIVNSLTRKAPAKPEKATALA